MYKNRPGFSLAVAEDTVPVGGALAFRLVNESGKETSVGGHGAFDIQKRTDGNWQSVFWHDTHRFVYWYLRPESFYDPSVSSDMENSDIAVRFELTEES